MDLATDRLHFTGLLIYESSPLPANPLSGQATTSSQLRPPKLPLGPSVAELKSESMISQSSPLIETSLFPVLEEVNIELVNQGTVGNALCTYL